MTLRKENNETKRKVTVKVRVITTQVVKLYNKDKIESKAIAVRLTESYGMRVTDL